MKRSHQQRNVLLYAASVSDADMLYATGFECPDPFIFIRTAKGRRIFVMSDLELDRARATARAAHRVLSVRRFVERARERLGKPARTGDLIYEVLRELRIRNVVVPESFPAGTVDRLREYGIRLRLAPAPFFRERMYKSKDEVRAIRRSMQITESGMKAAVAVLARSRVQGGRVVWKGRTLTADILRRVINEAVFSQGCIPAHTIVAPGRHGCDPHDQGAGPIRAGQPVIIDIFPRSEKTGYYGDMTRTVVKGRAPERLRAMYNAVLAGQRAALRMIRHGVHGDDVHRTIATLFEERGFETGRKAGRMQGFFHGTGHGIGLDIHEPPRIAPGAGALEAGMVVTVEPGLYYYPLGGVRLEDTVLVTRTGIRNLTRFPKVLEIP